MIFITHSDSPALWQTYLSDPASITIKGILIFNEYLLFLLIVIVLFIGTCCLIASLYGLFTITLPQLIHFRVESAAWHWHFVDVVWLFAEANPQEKTTIVSDMLW